MRKTGLRSSLSVGWVQVAAVFVTVASVHIAEAKKKNCVQDESKKWKSMKEFKDKVKEMGFTDPTFKVSGSCYEIYAMKDGQKKEVYFDPTTLLPVEPK